MYQKHHSIGEWDGLSEKDFFTIVDVFKPFQAKIEQLILFGSRARGDFKETSDIDLSIF